MEILFDYLEEDSWKGFIDLTPRTPSSSPEACSTNYLPGFVRPIHTTISEAQYEHLLLQGALTLPSFPLQQALLQSFFECVLPSMPIINWQTFINIVSNKDGGQGRISLLLFQAIMFSATAFVNLDHLQKAGYSSREEAHEAFFEKAHVCDSQRNSRSFVQANHIIAFIPVALRIRSSHQPSSPPSHDTPCQSHRRER